MSTMQKYLPFFASAVLMWLVLFIIYPHYQYYIDPDGTAYLTIAQRYANGDYQTAINGYWSPWSCWLTALLIKQGLAAIPASVIINALGATGFLFISHSFFLKFKIINSIQWLLDVTLALFLCYAVFWQSFDDLWECFFLLAALRMMLHASFIQKPLLWVLYGLVGALGYFAKAYAFPFFILNTVVCVFFLTNGNRLLWLRISAVAILVMFFGAHFWIVQLYEKYHIWTTSTAGPLNTSWYLVGHPFWKDGIHLLIPPAYKDSPYYWEDPYLVNGIAPHFWDSWQLFGRQLLKIVQNLGKLLVSMVQLSVFFPVIAVVLVRFLLNRNARVTTAPTFTVALSFLLFPLGYVLVNFEARYIWYMLPLCMIAGSLFIQNHLSGKTYSKILPIVFAISFLIYPVYGLLTMCDNGKQEFEIAQQLKAAHLKGSFTGNGHPRVMSKIAYFSGMQYYALTKDKDVDDKTLLNDLRQDGVQYFLYLSEPNSFPGRAMTLFDKEPLDESGHQFPGLPFNGPGYVKVLQVNQ